MDDFHTYVTKHEAACSNSFDAHAPKSVLVASHRNCVAHIVRKIHGHMQGRREEGAGGGELAPGPKPVGAPNLRNILKLNKAPLKSERVQGINGCIKTH